MVGYKYAHNALAIVKYGDVKAILIGLQTVTEQSELSQKLLALLKPITELEEGLLVSAGYDGDKHVAVLKFYDPKTDKIVRWEDNTGHKPYCLSKWSTDKILALKRKDIKVEEIEKIDLISDSKIMVRKVIAEDPLVIGGIPGKSIRDFMDAWEADIKYYETYLYDKGLRVGTYYSIRDNHVIPIDKGMSPVVQSSLEQILSKNTGESVKFIQEWAELLGQPLCSFKRIALDIEVANEENRIPDADIAEQEIIGMSFYNDEEALMYTWMRESKDAELDGTNQTYDSLNGTKVTYKISVFPTEQDMLLAAFSKMMDYPFLITFNGDDFDIRYVANRGKRLEIKPEEIPIHLQRQEASLKHGIHIDMYRWFMNHSVKVYVYSNKYSDNRLDTITNAILGEGKIDFEGNVADLSTLDMSNYCVNDSRLTYNLTAINSSLMMKVLLIITRIAKMPMNDTSRLGVSNWVRSMLFYEHRRMNAIIPRQDELAEKGGASSEALIKGKKYKGGNVIEPKPGVYFGVSVLDFASLYPTVIKVYNLSYETVNCPHEECKVNIIPQTNNWYCKKKKGITSLTIGSLRDLRVGHYKHLSKDKTIDKDERELYSVVSQGVKVIMNGAYGSLGFETFALYCLPVAEATAALGRYSIIKTIEKAQEVGLSVLYSDTDSMVIETPDKAKTDMVIVWVEKEFGLELEIDKTYRYIVFSNRKKNYFGILQDGTADIKGLTGKKSMTPEFIQKAFYDCIHTLESVQQKEDFVNAKVEIKTSLTGMVTRLRHGEIPLTDMAFTTQMSMKISGYGKKNGSSIPQHVKAAKAMQDLGKEIKAGDIISYVKTKNSGVKPIALAKTTDIDVDKYLEYANNVFEQVLDSLGISFEEILGATTLDSFWS